MKAGWEVKALGDVFQTATGNTPSKTKKDYYGDEIPLVKPAELTDSLINNAADGLTLEGGQAARLAPIGSVLISCIGNLGKTGLAARDVAFNQQINAIFPYSSKAISEFMFYQALSLNFKSQLEALATGTTIPIVNKTRFNSITVTLPPLEEQKRIVSILDEAFEGLDRAQENAEVNLKSARELFEQRRRTLVSDKTAGEPFTLKDVCINFEYGTSSKSSATGCTPVLRMGNLQDGEIDWTSLVYSNDSKEREKYKLHKGDVLFNRTNSQAHVGKTSIFDGKMPAIFAGYLIRVTPEKEKLTNEFLNHYLNSDIAREYGRSVMGKSVNQANISGSRLKTYPINLPDLATQYEITLELDALKVKVQEMQANYQTKLQDISGLRQSLLQKAFAGELT